MILCGVPGLKKFNEIDWSGWKRSEVGLAISVNIGTWNLCLSSRSRLVLSSVSASLNASS